MFYRLSDSPTKKKRLPTGKDSGGGFLVEKRGNEENTTVAEQTFNAEPTNCIECHVEFIESYLRKHFDYSVCDNCR